MYFVKLVVWQSNLSPLSLYGKKTYDIPQNIAQNKYRSYRFGTKWCRVNNEHFHFGCAIRLEWLFCNNTVSRPPFLPLLDPRGIIRNSRTMHSAALKELFAKWVIVQPCPSSLQHTHTHTLYVHRILLSRSSRLHAPPDFAPERKNKTI